MPILPVHPAISTRGLPIQRDFGLAVATLPITHKLDACGKNPSKKKEKTKNNFLFVAEFEKKKNLFFKSNHGVLGSKSLHCVWL
jgi:hypothetical protein